MFEAGIVIFGIAFLVMLLVGQQLQDPEVKVFGILGLLCCVAIMCAMIVIRNWFPSTPY